MRIGVLAVVQHSMFSSGFSNFSLAIAELLREMGHEVHLLQTTLNSKGWWEDCSELKQHWTVVPLSDASGYDVVFEQDRVQLSSEQRQRITKASILVLRKPFLLNEMEASLFPVEQTPRRDWDKITEIWLSESAAVAEPHAIQTLELLSRKPVRVVPLVWTPSIVATYMKEIGLPGWMPVTLSELKRGVESGASAPPPWQIHITETNQTNASAAVLPLVILREAKRRGLPIGRYWAHNMDLLKDCRFFKENTYNHCMDADVGLSGELIGRQRCPDWTAQAMSCVLSHIRFSVVRTVLLDVVWAGIPLIHNAPWIAQIGNGLERTAYTGNSVGEACDAFARMTEDLKAGQGVFAPDALAKIRQSVLARFSPLSGFVQEGWRAALESLAGRAAELASAPAPAAVAAVPAQERKVLRVGFCDMWEAFNPAYNFFTLMLEAAAGEKVHIEGVPADSSCDLVVFGPFGDAWKSLPATIPKVHFTGENTEPVRGEDVKLNLGFHHFDMTRDDYLRFPLWLLEIDWFGASAERIQNPKPIPLEACTRVTPADRTRKTKFCAFVVSNPSNPVRNAAFHWLNEYKPVDSGGRLFNTIGPALFAGAGGGGGEVKKFEFFKDYKFAITYENNSSRGYTTEKYLHAKAAGCIPIYWGDPAVERDFDLRGAIDARKIQTPEELIEAVRAVDEDDAEWERRFNVPALDSYKVEWSRRTMAECARRMLRLGGLDPNSVPAAIGRLPEEGVSAPPPAVVAPVAVTAPLAQPAPGQLELPIPCTTATRKFLPSLHHWLTSIGTQTRQTPALRAIVWLGSDVPEDTVKTLRESFRFCDFRTLPDQEAPKEAAATGFTDFWAPEHYGWKLWVYKELANDPTLTGRMILYTDAGSFMCRWPTAWIFKAQKEDVCLLEDPREENRRWCSKEFCAALSVTEEELDAKQRLGGLVAFRAGSEAARGLFTEAYTLALRREVLAGPKWSGRDAAGRPTGHRHDQSILSILSLRRGVAVAPLDSVYCDVSLRKTFTSGRSLYVHRGNFTVHRKFLEGIDEAYVINLERRGDRMERLWKNCPELERRVERWNAVDGRKLRMTPAISRLLRPNDFHWKKAITGCALSHLGLWWKLAREPKDIENYLILEDDVKFRPGWEKAWAQAVEEGHIPEDYDILYLGGVLPPNREGFETMGKERYNDSFSRIRENTMWGQKQPTRYFHFCAYAYVLSRRGAEKILELLEGAGGYWTSADHILCNPVTVLKSYVFDPMVAGCYQDDDPVYAKSNFNDFSRIDGFDSDLWNNDERFSEEEKAMGAELAELNLAQAVADAANWEKPAPAAAGAAPDIVSSVIGQQSVEAAKEELRKVCVEEAAGVPPAPQPQQVSLARVVTHPIKQVPARLLCHIDADLKFRSLYEAEWLSDLFGRPSMLEIESIGLGTPPPSDCPIVILQRPHLEVTIPVLEAWSAAGAKFRILHLSDEFGRDDVRVYDLSGCVSVLRIYQREDLEDHPKVLTIPLGFHWTLPEGSKDSLRMTPRLPFRGTTWSFFGTNWGHGGGREQQLAPLLSLPEPVKHVARFFKNWNDVDSAPRDIYISTMLDSIFVPCPDGMNPETFRFYEALECGAVPLVVRTDANAIWVDWVSEELQLLPSSNWEEAAKFVKELSEKPELLETYRTRLLSAWQGWKTQLKKKVAGWLEAC
jgi:GR25 family glycosyltransferase involved in LPS biosynthesis